VDCTIPWITLADVWQFRDGRQRIVSDTAERVSAVGIANSAAVVHPANSVVLSRTASVGFSAIMGEEMATSQDFAVWSCGPRLLPEFLLYVLRAMTPDLRRVAAGSTHKTVYMPDIEQLRTPLPPTDVQARIVAALDDAIAPLRTVADLRNEQRSVLEERRKAVVARRMEGLFATAPVVPLRRLLTDLEQGVSPQCDNIPAADGEWGVIKTSAVRRGDFDPDENKRYPGDGTELSRYQLQSGDLLVTRGSGSRDLVGDCALVANVPDRLLLCDLTYRLRFGQDVEPEYIAEALLTHRLRGDMAASTRGGTGGTIKLRGEDIKELRVPLPPPAEQRDFATFARAARTRAGDLVKDLAASSALIDERELALVTAAVTGQMDLTGAAA
jgi:type I restriction enzyme S subunit